MSALNFIYIAVGIYSVGCLTGWFLKGKYGNDAAAAKALESAVTSAVAEVKPVVSAIKSDLSK